MNKLEKTLLISLTTLVAALVCWTAFAAAETESAPVEALAPAAAPQLPPALAEKVPMTPAEPADPGFEQGPEVEASCTCSDCGSTGMHWGKGTSCSAAEQDLVNQLWDTAAEICPGIVCGVEVVITTACWWSNQYNKYVVDGYGNVSCKICTGQSCFLY